MLFDEARAAFSNGQEDLSAQKLAHAVTQQGGRQRQSGAILSLTPVGQPTAQAQLEAEQSIVESARGRQQRSGNDGSRLDGAC